MRAWMACHRESLKYRVGILHFLRYAFANTPPGDTKPCPCRKCINSLNRDHETMYDHLMIDGILQDYRIWDFHGEKFEVKSHDSMSGELEASSKRRKLHSQSNQSSSEVMDRLQKLQERINEMEGREKQREAQWQAKVGLIVMRMQNQLLENFMRILQNMASGNAEGSRGPELLPKQDEPRGSKSHAEVVDSSY